MDTKAPAKGIGALGVFRRRPSGAGAPWTAGAALLGLSLAVLTALVATGRTIGLDQRVDVTMPVRGGGPAALHVFATAITTLANPPVTMALLMTSATVWAIWSRTPWPVVGALPAVGALTVTVLAGKWLLARPGPADSVPVDIFGAYPSGHTATALVCTGTLAVLVARRHPQYRRGLLVAVTGWTTLVAWSLLWLHFHWFSDVLGAALLGALLLWLLYRWPWYLVVPPGRLIEDAQVEAGFEDLLRSSHSFPVGPSPAWTPDLAVQKALRGAGLRKHWWALSSSNRRPTD